MKVSVTGGTPQTLATTHGRGTVANLVVDSTSVYWTTLNAGMVLKVPASGGAVFTLSARGSSPTSIAQNAASIYWVDGDDIFGVPKSGGEVRPVVTAHAGIIAADNDAVYWTTVADNAVDVMKRALCGGPTVTLATGLQAPTGLAVDATNVFWVDQVGEVVRLAK